MRGSGTGDIEGSLLNHLGVPRYRSVKPSIRIPLGICAPMMPVVVDVSEVGNEKGWGNIPGLVDLGSYDINLKMLVDSINLWTIGLLGVQALPGVANRRLDLILREGSVRFGEEEARLWANGFTIPSSSVADGIRRFNNAGRDERTMVSGLLEELQTTRMSVESVMSVISPNNPERDKLIRLVKGMPLFTDPGFVPLSKRSDLKRQLTNCYRRMAPTVNRMLYEDFLSKGLAFILPLDVVEKNFRLYHFSRLSWAPKVGKAKGRPILDCSAGKDPLNSVFTKVESDSCWGIISHPTIFSLVRMIEDFISERSLSYDDITLWKMDLKGAYTLLSFEGDDVPLVGAALDQDLAIFFLCGVFGWTGTPAAFQVVSRALRFQINEAIEGVIDIYVDDLCGVSTHSSVEADISMAGTICKALFKSECIESSKTMSGRRVEFIGYVLDLDKKIVSVTERNFNRVIYGLCQLHSHSVVSKKLVQRFGSWISRYSVIFPVLKPFVRDIFASIHGRGDFSKFQLDPEAVRSLMVFRAIFFYSLLREREFARSFDSMLNTVSQYTIEFDASLSGAGILWFQDEDPDGGRCLGAASVSFNSLGFGCDSGFQNEAEFTAALIGLFGSIRLGGTGCRVRFKGDSIAALSWLEKGRIKGKIPDAVCAAFTFVSWKYKVHICDCIHIPGVDNTSADALSRGSSLSDVRVSDIRLLSAPTMNLECDEFLRFIAQHRNKATRDADFIEMWRCLPSIIQRVLEK